MTELERLRPDAPGLADRLDAAMRRDFDSDWTRVPMLIAADISRILRALAAAPASEPAAPPCVFRTGCETPEECAKVGHCTLVPGAPEPRPDAGQDLVREIDALLAETGWRHNAGFADVVDVLKRARDRLHQLEHTATLVEQGSAALTLQVNRCAELEAALAESVKLQSHYADLLNMHDGGERMQFTVDSWLARLAALAHAAQQEPGGRT